MESKKSDQTLNEILPDNTSGGIAKGHAMPDLDVLFAWELGGGLGHIGRLRPLADAMQRQGKRVAFAARDLRFCSTIFHNTSIPWFQAPIKLGRPQDEILEPRTFADILWNVGFGDVDELRSMVFAWRNLFDALNPKLVVLEHSPTTLLALRGSTIKSVVVGLGFFCPPDQSPLPDLRPWMPGSPSLEAESRVLASMNAILRETQQRPLHRVSQLYAEANEIALITFPDLDHYGARPQTRYWGAWDSAWGIVPEWPPQTGPKVFFYLKACSVLPGLLAAVANLGISAIVYVPELPADKVRAMVGDAALVLDQPANLRQVFNACDLVVLHGTHGVATEALLAGKPLVNLPLTLEQLLLSKRIEQIGAGVIGSPVDLAQTLQVLRFALDQGNMKSIRLREGAQRFAQRYAALNPETQAHRLAERIVSLLE